MRLPHGLFLVQLGRVTIAPCFINVLRLLTVRGYNVYGVVRGVQEGLFSSWEGKQTQQACNGSLPGWRTASHHWTHATRDCWDVLFLHKALWSNHKGSDGTLSTLTKHTCLADVQEVPYFLIRGYQMKKNQILLPKLRGCILNLGTGAENKMCQIFRSNMVTLVPQVSCNSHATSSSHRIVVSYE